MAMIGAGAVVIDRVLNNSVEAGVFAVLRRAHKAEQPSSPK
jgi:serine acetyltransferase